MPRPEQFHRIDGGYAWVVVTAAFVTNMITVGCLRSAGVFLVILHSDYGFTRLEATIVGVTTFGTVFCTSVLSMTLLHHFGYRKVSLLGAVIAFVGVGSSYFVTSPPLLIVTFGFLQGLGYGILFIPTQSIIPHYFKKHLAKATGVGLAGGALGTCILPPLLGYLLEKYGLHGTYLIMSGIVLNVVVSSSLMLEPPTSQKMTVKYVKVDREINKVQLETIASRTDHSEGHMDEVDGSGVQDKEENDVTESETLVEETAHVTIRPSSLTEDVVYKPTVEEIPATLPLKQKLLHALKLGFFYVSIVNIISGVFVMTVFTLTMPDYAVMAGSSIQDATFIISSSAIADFICKMVFGFLIDHSLIRLSNSFMMTLFCAGASFILVAAVGNTSFAVLVVLGVITNICSASHLIHIPVAIVKYLGHQYVSTCMSVGGFLCTPVVFLTAPLCYAFLQNYGSYAGVYYTSAGVLTVNTFIWLFVYVNEIRNDSRVQTRNTKL